MKEFSKNVPNWTPTKKDYRLVFRLVDGIWQEVSNNLPEFSAMTLAEYLAYMDIIVDDRCTFMRLMTEHWTLEYRAAASSITIDYMRRS